MLVNWGEESKIVIDSSEISVGNNPMREDASLGKSVLCIYYYIFS